MSSHTLTFRQTDAQGKPLQVDTLAVKKAILLLRALNHKLRGQILKFIDEKGETTVTDIYQHLLLEQSVASQQLAILRKAGFVKTSRKGKFVHYSLNGERIGQLGLTLKQLLS